MGKLRRVPLSETKIAQGCIAEGYFAQGYTPPGSSQLFSPSSACLPQPYYPQPCLPLPGLWRLAYSPSLLSDISVPYLLLISLSSRAQRSDLKNPAFSDFSAFSVCFSRF
jgi:hypothetical protein